MPETRSEYDVLVIGGGPAGCAAAILLARQGHRVLVAEKERFPRFHIGESLLPASNGLLRRLGLESPLRRAGFVEKRGASFASGDGRFAGYVDFSASREVAEPQTYNVPRDRFDALVLEAAERSGAEVRQGWSVRSVRFSPEGAEAALDDRRRRESVRASMVIDASGQAGILARQLGMRRTDPALRNVAIHAQFEGIPRPEGPRSGDVRVVTLDGLAWVWLIPLSDRLTSVGLVVPRRGEGPAAGAASTGLEERLRSVPVLAPAMAAARRVTPERRDADFSYWSVRYRGDRWLLAGDAGSFLDPVFSTGVHIAISSGCEAADAAHRCLLHGGPDRGSLSAFEGRQRARYRFFRRFSLAFYDPAFRDLFLQPSNRLGLQEAVTTSLAGIWPPSISTRVRLWLFFSLVALQSYIPLAQRTGAPAAAQGAEAPEPG